MPATGASSFVEGPRAGRLNASLTGVTWSVRSAPCLSRHAPCDAVRQPAPSGGLRRPARRSLPARASQAASDRARSSDRPSLASRPQPTAGDSRGEVSSRRLRTSPGQRDVVAGSHVAIDPREGETVDHPRGQFAAGNRPSDLDHDLAEPPDSRQHVIGRPRDRRNEVRRERRGVVVGNVVLADRLSDRGQAGWSVKIELGVKRNEAVERVSMTHQDQASQRCTRTSGNRGKSYLWR